MQTEGKVPVYVSRTSLVNSCACWGVSQGLPEPAGRSRSSFSSQELPSLSKALSALCLNLLSL